SRTMFTTPPNSGGGGKALDTVFRFMTMSGEGLNDPTVVPHPALPDKSRFHGAGEVLFFKFHASTVTHLDALCHIMWDGTVCNGHPAGCVTVGHGATKLAVTSLAEGIFTRGVLLDIPRLRGMPWLGDEDGAVFPEDIAAAEAQYDITIRPGDVV